MQCHVCTVPHCWINAVLNLNLKYFVSCWPAWVYVYAFQADMLLLLLLLLLILLQF